MRIINGDCEKILFDLIKEGIKIDLTLTSPPYDNLRTYQKGYILNFQKFKRIANLLYEITKTGGCVVWVVADATINGSETGTAFKQALYFKKIGFNLHDTMIFAKKNPIPYNHKRYEQVFEFMFIFSKGRIKTFNPIKIPTKTKGEMNKWELRNKESKIISSGKNAIVKNEKIHGNIFYYNCGGKKNNNFHPAVFPKKLDMDMIMSWSDEKDIVLDPFMGSGTTAIAAEELGRQFIGIEKNKEYIIAFKTQHP